MKECSQKELADHLDCSVVTIRGYERGGWVRRRMNGKYDLETSRRNVITRLRELADARNGAGGLADARADLARAQREAVEWKSGRAKADFVSAEAVIKLLREDFKTNRKEVRSWAGALPEKLQGKTAAEMGATLENEVHWILTRLADPGTYPPI